MPTRRTPRRRNATRRISPAAVEYFKQYRDATESHIGAVAYYKMQAELDIPPWENIEIHHVDPYEEIQAEE